MKFATEVRAMSALVFLALGAETLHAGSVFSGTVLRVDEQTCRIQFSMGYTEGPYSGCLGEPPTEGARESCVSMFNYFILSGPFGLPRNSDCGLNEDHVSCGDWPFPYVTSRFDFDAPLTGSSRLTLEWTIQGDWYCQWCPSGFATTGECGGSYDHCGPDVRATGLVSAVLPTRIGDSVPLEPVLAVEATAWGMVKRLYRE